MKTFVILFLGAMVLLVPTIYYVENVDADIGGWLTNYEVYEYEDDDFGQFLLDDGLLALFPKDDGTWRFFRNVFRLGSTTFGYILSPIIDLLGDAIPSWLLPSVSMDTPMYHANKMDWTIDWCMPNDDLVLCVYGYIGSEDIETAINTILGTEYSISRLYYDELDQSYTFVRNRLFGLWNPNIRLSPTDAEILFGVLYD